MNAIAILDNGGQFTHLIANTLRNTVHVRADIFEPDVDVGVVKDYRGIILSGGPASIYDKAAPPFNEKIFDIDIPILGLCYGHHLMARHYGANVQLGKVKEYGYANLNLNLDADLSGLFLGLETQEQVWMSHGDTVTTVPDGFEVLGSTSDCFIAVMSNPAKKRYGFQFHPEVSDTINGRYMLENFVTKICGCKQDWTMNNYIPIKIKALKEQIGDRQVLILVSGGVDSTVCAALLAKVVDPSKLFAIHIDNGLMRHDESLGVIKTLKEFGVKNVKLVDAADEFVGALKGITHPEEKRKIIGNMFITVSNREAEALNLSNWLLAQGTIYPDTIESGGTKHADVIKTHHNRVEIIQKMIAEGKIVEPISDLYKVEVRELGIALGIPKDMVGRHPFPGPGLGIRVLCSDGTSDDVSAIEKEARAKLPQDLDIKVLPVKSVGVKGDARSYEHPALLIPRSDIVTPAQIKRVGTILANSVKGINRVVMLVAPEKIESIKLEKAYVTKERLDKVREADHIIMEGLRSHKLYDKIWQCPIVLLPLLVNGGEFVLMRPIHSDRAMTAEAATPEKGFIDDMRIKIMGIKGIGGFGIDLTNKPPGTIEWE